MEDDDGSPQVLNRQKKVVWEVGPWVTWGQLEVEEMSASCQRGR